MKNICHKDIFRILPSKSYFKCIQHNQMNYKWEKYIACQNVPRTNSKITICCVYFCMTENVCLLFIVKSRAKKFYIVRMIR